MFFRAKYLPTRVARWYIFKQIWVNLEGLAVEDVGTLYFHSIDFTANLYILWQFGIFFAYLVYFLLIWYILCLFGIFYAYLVYFFLFLYVVARKIWQPCCPLPFQSFQLWLIGPPHLTLVSLAIIKAEIESIYLSSYFSYQRATPITCCA
jgi:hypothetical protein